MPQTNFTGIDLSKNMIKKTDNKNIKNAQFIVGDCENLPFSNESFDIVIYAMSIHHYPNPESFVKNVFRISTPGGKLIIRDPSASDLKLFFYRTFGYYRYLNKFKSNGVVKFYSPKQLIKILRSKGFQILSASRIGNNRLQVVAEKV